MLNLIIPIASFRGNNEVHINRMAIASGDPTSSTGRVILTKFICEMHFPGKELGLPAGSLHFLFREGELDSIFIFKDSGSIAFIGHKD